MDGPVVSFDVSKGERHTRAFGSAGRPFGPMPQQGKGMQAPVEHRSAVDPLLYPFRVVPDDVFVKPVSEFREAAEFLFVSVEHLLHHREQVPRDEDGIPPELPELIRPCLQGEETRREMVKATRIAGVHSDFSQHFCVLLDKILKTFKCHK
jgi:hypothetical protein